LILKSAVERDFPAINLMRSSGQRKLQNNNILTEKIKKFSTFIGAFILAANLFSQNPIVLPGLYFADPSAGRGFGFSMSNEPREKVNICHFDAFRFR